MKQAEDYGSLKPVTVLSIQNHLLFPEDVPCLSFHQTLEESTSIVKRTGVSPETVREILRDVPAGSSGGWISGAG